MGLLYHTCCHQVQRIMWGKVSFVTSWENWYLLDMTVPLYSQTQHLWFPAHRPAQDQANQHPSMNGGGVREAPPLAQELLAVDGWEGVIYLQMCNPAKLLMIQRRLPTHSYGLSSVGLKILIKHMKLRTGRGSWRKGMEIDMIKIHVCVYTCIEFPTSK